MRGQRIVGALCAAVVTLAIAGCGRGAGADRQVAQGVLACGFSHAKTITLARSRA